MNFILSEEQQMIIATTKAFVENELYPYEAEVEETGVLRPELIAVSYTHLTLPTKA